MAELRATLLCTYGGMAGLQGANITMFVFNAATLVKSLKKKAGEEAADVLFLFQVSATGGQFASFQLRT